MESLFYPIEHAILSDWFKIERHHAAKGIDIWAEREVEPVSYDEHELEYEFEHEHEFEDYQDESQDENSKPQGGPIRIRPDTHGDLSPKSLDNAVARIVLEAIQNRLPQWSVVSNKKKSITSGRKLTPIVSRKVHLIPQFLFWMNWADSAPGYSWPESYHAAFVPGYDRYVVTISQDSPDVHGYTDVAIGWFLSTCAIIEGAKEIITKWWRWQKEEWEQEAWAEFLGSGIVSGEIACSWRNDVWLREEDEDFRENLPGGPTR